MDYIRALWWLFAIGFVPGLILAGLFVWHWRGVGPAWSYGAMLMTSVIFAGFTTAWILVSVINGWFGGGL